MIILRIFLLLLFSFSLGFPGAKAETGNMSHAASVYDFSFQAIDGAPLPLDTYRGKVLLIVNTASACGFTGQYAGLEKLYETYKDRGLVVIGVPSNDFGGQEPGSEQEIAGFTRGKFNITFPLTAKEKITGGDAHPLYQWMGAAGVGGILFSKPRWNFHKYLLSRDGRPLAAFPSMTDPQDGSLIKKIEAALAE
jgi:glutathione peroxidase